jgi:hypothetical protein
VNLSVAETDGRTQAPAPVVAGALGFHQHATARHVAIAGGTWNRYAASHEQLSDALAQFMDDHPCGSETLRHDLARFRCLLRWQRYRERLLATWARPPIPVPEMIDSQLELR